MRIKNIIIISFLWFASTLSATIPATVHTVNLQGNLSVNKGKLYYSVPLRIPEGIAGMKPKISLNYSSNEGTRYFGEGWSLSVQSSIYRCSSNYQFDNITRAVAYDSKDNICMDGQRLIAVSGPKWTANSIYKTRIDSYQKVVFDGSNFTVWEKSGNIREYKLYNYSWLLTKVSDRYNNSINYVYQTTDTEVYLSDITYADNSIHFNYQEKPFISFGYQNGKKYEFKKLVKSIDIKHNGNTLRSYTLSYDGFTGGSHDGLTIPQLTTIQETDQNDTLEPLQFQYEDKAFNVQTSSAITNITSKKEDLKFADFNGDGFIDIYEVKEGDDIIWLNDGNGNFLTSSYTITNITATTSNIKFADLNNDNFVDMYVIYPDHNQIFFNDKLGHFTESISSPIFVSEGKNIYLNDFNGDSRIDILFTTSSGYIILENKGNGYFEQIKEVNIPNFSLDAFHVADLNNDGISDIYINSSKIILKDFNGDGFLDIYTVNGGSDTISFNNGKGEFLETISVTSGISAYTNIQSLDFNNDGLADIYLVKSGNSEIWINRGDGRFSLISRLSNWNNTVLTDLNGDGYIDIYNADDNNSDHILYSTFQHSKITSIIDSFKNETVIKYAHINEKINPLYKKYTDAIYPNVDLINSYQVVSSVTSPTVALGTSTTTYKYEGLKINLQGLGSLGFAKITSYNQLIHSETVTIYHQDYPFIGLIKNSSTYLNNNLISKTDLDYESIEPSTFQYSTLNYSKVQQVYNTQKITNTYDAGIVLKVETSINSDIDIYGNIHTIKSFIYDNTLDRMFSKVISNQYTNDENKWILGRLTYSTVHNSTGDDQKERISSFSYNQDTGILESETIEPTNNDKWLQKSYGYDSHGNKIRETISGADIQTRTTNIQYDTQGKFAQLIINPLNQTVTKAYNLDGQVTQVTDPNTLPTITHYDNFGRKIEEDRPDGTKTTISYQLDTSAPQSYYSVTVKSDGVPPIITYYNRMNQAVRTTKIGFDGRLINEDVLYNDFGKIIQKSMPYYTGDTPVYSYMNYDEFQRVKTVDTPAQNNQRAVTTTLYDKYKTTVTNAKGQKKITIKNAIGQVIRVEEEEGASEDYHYDALGNLTKTIDAHLNEINVKYDIFGNKTDQYDPDMGHWTYDYNALGELKTQTDAKGQVTSFDYDLLGRKTYENANGEISQWSYDHNGKIGTLSVEVKQPNFRKEYYYDGLGRLSNIRTVNDSKTFMQSFTYDQYGRLSTKTLPNNFHVINIYNDYGYLEAIKSPRYQIVDFDPAHFTDLLNRTLDSALSYYQQSLEYQAQADTLRQKETEYRTLAAQYESDRDELLSIANQLEANAQEYDRLAAQQKAYSVSTKNQADYYSRILNDYYTYQPWNTGAIQYFQEQVDRYTQYSTIHAEMATNYLNQAASLRESASTYLESAAISEESMNNYLALADDALQEVNQALKTAEEYAKRAEQGNNASAAYQEILQDPNFTYFYKILTQDSSDRVTSYISGNGLITAKEYDASGVLNRITTGFNFDNYIRDISYQYDSLANVTNRDDKIMDAHQAYFYDGLNRVTTDNVSLIKSSEAFTFSYTYDEIGNFQQKEFVGSFTYDPSKVHQVKTAGQKSFDYDANGNMTNNNGTIIQYTSFNKVSQITTANNVIRFNYDANHQRYKKTTNSYSTYYIDKSYEYTQNNDGTFEDKYFIYVGSKVMSIYTNKFGTHYSWLTGTQTYLIQPSTKYLHYDALNSVATITNGNGIVEQKMLYKPFGEQFNFDESGNYISATSNNRGFTGHERIQETEFVNMNARLYDPTIGRFLSADTMIPNIFDTESFNRYSYVRNNPLNYIDPSGHSWFSNWAGKASNWLAENERKVEGTALIILGVVGLFNPEFGGFYWGPSAMAAGVAFLNYDPDEPDGPNNNIGVYVGTEGTPGINVYEWGANGTSYDEERRIYAIVNDSIGGTGSSAITTDYKSINGASTDSYFTIVTSNNKIDLSQNSQNSQLNNIDTLTYHSQQSTSWDLNNDGRLSLSEANYWYRNGNGQPITINGNTVNILRTGILNSRGMEYAYGFGMDYLIHGRVMVNPKNGHIYDGMYDFNMDGTDQYFHFNDGWAGYRDGATRIGKWFAGRGQAYEIQYRYPQ